MKKKVFHIIDSLNGKGGAEVLLCNSITPLNKNFENIIITITPGSLFIDELIENKHISLAKSFSKTQIPQYISSLKKLIKEHQPDIIHSHLFWSTIIARFACPKKTKLVSTIHSFYFLPSNTAVYGWKINMLDKLTYKKRYHLIFITQKLREAYFRQYKLKDQNASVIYNAVDDIFFRYTTNKYQAKNYNNKQLKILMIGNLKGEKNYPFILNALHKQSITNYKLDIYGLGPQENQLKEIIKQNKQEENVQLMGRSEKVHELYANYDLFIMASKVEGFGIALVEALAQKIPVICSDIDVFKEIVDDGVIYFKSNDSDDFAHSLKKFIQLSEDKKTSLIDKGYKQASKYSNQTYCDKLVSTYNKLIAI